MDLTSKPTLEGKSSVVEQAWNARKLLSISATLWLTIVLIGQWIFALFIFAFYGGTAITGNYDAWNTLLPTGIAEGDEPGNASLVAHLFFAAVLNIGGPLQLVPQVRSRFPRFHRWNGRVFLTGSVIAASVGLFMQWTRGNMGGFVMDIGNSSAALIIFICSVLVWKTAVNKRFDIHRKWSFRLFMVVSATWFFRLGIILWFALTGGIGIDAESFTGPFISFWAFGQYLLPLVLLEFYFISQQTSTAWIKLSGAVLITLSSLAIAAGVLLLTVGFWLPFLSKYL